MILQLEIAAILRKTQNPLKIQVHFELEATWSSRAPTFQTPAIETCLDSFQGHTKILRRQFCIEVVYSILKKQFLIPVQKGEDIVFSNYCDFLKCQRFFPPILAQFSHYLAQFCSKVMPSRTLEALPIPSTKYKTLLKNTEKPPIASTNTTLYRSAHLQSLTNKAPICLEGTSEKKNHGNFFLMRFHGTTFIFRPIFFWWSLKILHPTEGKLCFLSLRPIQSKTPKAPK